MSHESYEELADHLNDVSRLVAPGTIWRHYKGGEYLVSGVAIDEETDEAGVIYSDLEHPEVPIFRKMASFLSRVELDGILVARFQPEDDFIGSGGLPERG